MIDEVQAFHDAWRVAARHEVSAHPDATIRLALLRLGLGFAGRVAHGQSETRALQPFQAAVAKRDSLSTDPSTLEAHAFRDGDRMLVNVSMGSASAVFAFDRDGREMAVPPAFAWSYRFQGPFRRVGRLILFDAESILDAGVRYDYRLGVLRRTPQGYASAGLVEGSWTYGRYRDAHLSARGPVLIINTLDTPRAFSVSNSERVLRRVGTWDTRSGAARRSRSVPLDPDLRAVDAWLAHHVGTRVDGGYTVGRKAPYVERIRRYRGGITLSLDGTDLRFDLGRGGRTLLVRRVAARPN